MGNARKSSAPNEGWVEEKPVVGIDNVVAGHRRQQGRTDDRKRQIDKATPSLQAGRRGDAKAMDSWTRESGEQSGLGRIRPSQAACDIKFRLALTGCSGCLGAARTGTGHCLLRVGGGLPGCWAWGCDGATFWGPVCSKSEAVDFHYFAP